MVLNRIPKGAVIPVPDEQQRLIREALDGGTEMAWGGFDLLVIEVWGALVSLVEWGKFSFSTMVRQQVARFMESTDLSVVRVPLEWGMGSVEGIILHVFCSEELAFFYWYWR